MSAMIDMALAYAAAGLPVFPCNPSPVKEEGSKAPLTPGERPRGAKNGGHWLATTDAATVAGWWRRWPHALIGFPTGARTGAVVIDLDPRTAELGAMVEALTVWCGGGLAWIDPATGEIVEPAVALTQSGGLHLYFADVPEALNRTGLFERFIATGEAGADLAHIDVRAQGGYVIAPPSVMANGARYRWVRRPCRNPQGGWLLPPLPRALRAVILRERQPLSPQSPASRQHRPVIGGEEGLRRYLDRKINAVLDRVRAAPEGQRNQMIFWGAARLGELTPRFLSRSEAFQLIRDNLPAGVGANEPKALRTIENGLDDPKNVAFDPESAAGRHGFNSMVRG